MAPKGFGPRTRGVMLSGPRMSSTPAQWPSTVQVAAEGLGRRARATARLQNPGGDSRRFTQAQSRARGCWTPNRGDDTGIRGWPSGRPQHDTGAVTGEGVTRGTEAGWYADSSSEPQSLGDQDELSRAGQEGVALKPQPCASGFHRTPLLGPLLRVGGLRALPTPVTRTGKVLGPAQPGHRGHQDDVPSRDWGVYHLVLFCGD